MKNWDAIPKQKFLVENGEVGDCWRCCVAALIDKPAEEVPHFVRDYQKEYPLGAEEWTEKWLKDRDFSLIWIKQPIPPGNFVGPYILTGISPRAKGKLNVLALPSGLHSVIAIDNQIVYDPHPSNAGLTAVYDAYLILPRVII